MANQAWLESSLRRSGRLGLEVLERASRRSVDWSSTGASHTSTTSDENAYRAQSELHDAFATMTEFMEQTSRHCKTFYESGCCTEPSDAERTHVSRFHARPGTGRTTSALPQRKHQVPVSAAGEDFYIEVSPGTYAVTATLPDSQRQTRLVSVRPGESVNMVFKL